MIEPPEKIYAWEGALIIQLHRLTGIVHMLTKQLYSGRSESEVAGAYMDLRNVAHQIERLSKDVP